MSSATRSPMRVLAGTNQSGFINDGIQQTTPGGQYSYTSFSGLGAATLIASGPGRLNSVLVIANLQSGRPVFFVDAHAVTSGMPFSTSGHKIVGVIPEMMTAGAGASGLPYIINPLALAGASQALGFSFNSGLVACPLVSGGGPSFTVNWTPAKSNQSGGFIGGIPPV